jgi:Ser/Thr protein kinase RdoA (MazF antagonist)
VFYKKAFLERQNMRRSTFPAQSSILSSEALLKWLERKYCWRQPPTCVFYRKGVNDTYKVTTRTSNFYLRVYLHGWRTKEDVEAEINLLKVLDRHDIPISKPVRRLDGSYVQQLVAPEGARYAVLFTGGEGMPVDSPSRRQSFTYGVVAARIHNCTDRQRKVYKRFHVDCGHLIGEPLKSLRPFLGHRRKDFDFLERIGEGLKAEAMKLPRTVPEYGICHGDLHPMNVLFKDSGELTLFDFDCFGYGWRAYDISVFLWNRHWIGYLKMTSVRYGSRLATSVLPSTYGIAFRRSLSFLPLMFSEEIYAQIHHLCSV